MYIADTTDVSVATYPAPSQWGSRFDCSIDRGRGRSIKIMGQSDNIRMIAIGAFIRTVRESGKTPKVYSCLKEAGMKRPSALLCRKLEKALKELHVYGVHRDGTAFLYKENWDSKQLLDQINDLVKNMEDPAPRKYTRRTTVELPKQEAVPVLSIDLSGVSEEELLAEIKRREDFRKAQEELNRKKALLRDAAELCGISLDELISIAVEIADII